MLCIISNNLITFILFCSINTVLECPTQEAPMRGMIRSEGPYMQGDRLYVECAYGYSMIGKHELVCMQNGVWSDPMPICSSKFH